MKTPRSYRSLAKASLVLLAAVLCVAVTAAPAFADELVIVDMIFAAEQLQPQIGDGGGFEMVPAEEPIIGDAGDWEMVPVDEPPFPDAGDWEMVPVDEPLIPDGGDDAQEPTETPEPGDQDTPQGSEETPQSDVPTETPQSETTTHTPDEPALPFTGGNEAAYGLVGLGLALAGGGYLIRKRHVFGRH